MKNLLRWVLPLSVLGTLTLSSCATGYRHGPPPRPYGYGYHHRGYGRPLPPPPPPRGAYRY